MPESCKLAHITSVISTTTTATTTTFEFCLTILFLQFRSGLGISGTRYYRLDACPAGSK